eukprot:TRINITY_DN6780_c0_g1_i2.p2 TRINITY_DN6780_c0_g1~~TRINITY_DN6780_c0_g1_i2.p2  ORF type:complete len:158 (+),score=6.53 TRINITY_DN6780_c0_g1_i2:198-671(+)
MATPRPLSLLQPSVALVFLLAVTSGALAARPFELFSRALRFPSESNFQDGSVDSEADTSAYADMSITVHQRGDDDTADTPDADSLLLISFPDDETVTATDKSLTVSVGSEGNAGDSEISEFDGRQQEISDFFADESAPIGFDDRFGQSDTLSESPGT